MHITKSTEHRIKFILKIIVFILYLSVLSYGLFFAEALGRDGSRAMGYNLIPFHEIHRYLKYANQLGLQIVLMNLLGNILMFVPFGFLVPLFWRKEEHHPVIILLMGCLFSCVVEVIQLQTGLGTCDIDDVILNTVGTVFGYFLFRLGNRVYRSMTNE
ncbi:MAG: VanZ family protein [Lachnospiraceae bacterium]|nr:VanZ family protein [Lachnospiraceae bacterium]